MLEVRQGFVAPAYLRAPHREAQKVAVTHRRNLAFDRVDREFEGVFKVARDTFHHPLSGTLAFNQDEHVIGVPGKAVAPPMQLVVELIEQDIGQQGRQRPALRRSDVAGLMVPTDLGLAGRARPAAGPFARRKQSPGLFTSGLSPSSQVAPDQAQQPFVGHVLAVCRPNRFISTS